MTDGDTNMGVVVCPHVSVNSFSGSISREVESVVVLCQGCYAATKAGKDLAAKAAWHSIDAFEFLGDRVWITQEEAQQTISEAIKRASDSGRVPKPNRE